MLEIKLNPFQQKYIAHLQSSESPSRRVIMKKIDTEN